MIYGFACEGEPQAMYGTIWLGYGLVCRLKDDGWRSLFFGRFKLESLLSTTFHLINISSLKPFYASMYAMVQVSRFLFQALVVITACSPGACRQARSKSDGRLIRTSSVCESFPMDIDKSWLALLGWWTFAASCQFTSWCDLGQW